MGEDNKRGSEQERQAMAQQQAAQMALLAQASDSPAVFVNGCFMVPVGQGLLRCHLIESVSPQIPSKIQFAGLLTIENAEQIGNAFIQIAQHARGEAANVAKAEMEAMAQEAVAKQHGKTAEEMFGGVKGVDENEGPRSMRDLEPASSDIDERFKINPNAPYVHDEISGDLAPSSQN